MIDRQCVAKINKLANIPMWNLVAGYFSAKNINAWILNECQLKIKHFGPIIKL